MPSWHFSASPSTKQSSSRLAESRLRLRFCRRVHAVPQLGEFFNRLLGLFRSRTERLARLLHGRLERLAGLIPAGIVDERYGAAPLAFASVFARRFAAAAEAGAVVRATAGMFGSCRAVGLAGAVVLLAFDF